MRFRSWIRSISVTALIVSASTISGWAEEHPHYFVSIDNRTTIVGGEYNGLPNPNAGRLTFLIAHTDEEEPSTNHFHSIGSYSYTGPAANPTIVPTNTNNRIPETFSLQPPITLSPRAGRFVSGLSGEEYANLKTESIQSLSGFPPHSPEGFLFHSSQERWTAPLTGAVLTLELVAVTPGLHISNEVNQEVLTQVGDTYTLGDGNNFLFAPTFWTSTTAAAGTYSATFRLKDANGGNAPFGESGTFHFDFRVPSCFGVRATIVGTAGNDNLSGSSGNDVILALGGDDRINGKGGHDVICGDAGNDSIDGGDGDDQVDGGIGNDTLAGRNGNDHISGGEGNDAIEGGDGDDALTGGDGDDQLQGRNGNDQLDGGSGRDALDGNGGADSCQNGEKVQRCES